MGPIQQLDPASEYSPEELEVYQQKTELSPDDLDEQLVTSVFDDPTYIPTREEYFTARDAKARLKAEGKLPGLLEDAATGATGFIQTLADMGHEILDDPGDFLARSPATMLATVRKSWRNTNDVARWLRSTNRLDPIGRDEQTGEFIFGQTGAGMDDADYLARQQQLAAEQGRKIRPVNEEDLKDYEYDFFLSERARQKELEEWVASTTAPTEFVTMLVTGRNQVEQPMQATSDIAGGLVEATNVATMGVPLSAGAKSLGFSRVAKAGGSRAARLLEKAAQTGIEGMETGAARFQNLIQKTTRLAPETQTKIAKWSAAGGVGGAAFGMESQIPGVSQLQDGAKVIGGAYLGYKLGLGTLRTVQKVAGPTSTILRVAADPADGLDPIAQASVATKLAAFPELAPVREVLENPTKFRAIESTPARLAADPRLGPQTRAVMEGLANPLVVQGVRGASAVAGGAVKGAAANTPFVALAMNAEEDKAAANMLGIGGAFGAAGGAINRFGGVRQRRAEARVSDIGRMFMDVELAGGDVAGLAKTYSPQQLGDMAAMQGIFRNRVEFVPLAQADYDLNVQANGGAGSAGLFVQAPPGEKARVFVNLDARRDGIAPHEFGHALLSSGALGGAQAAEIRANVNRRYTQAGVEARATEYARNLIAAQNEKAFPGQNLPISQDAIQAKIDELGQSGLMRGDMDTLDWVRDELFAEEFRTASANLDFAAIRRGMPADGSWLGSMEKVLGGHANALSISGVRIDPATGAPIDTPQTLFRDNPILAADKTLIKNLDTYIKNYRQWLNHPEQTKPRGVRVAPTARPQDLANNPQVTFHDLGNGVRGNDFAILDPATGQPMLRSQAEINAETLKRQQQMRSLVGSKLLPATDPNLGPKKTADGRVTIRGRVLPQQFDFLNGFAQHIRGFGRQFEQHAARGESMQVRYHAIGSGDTGAFRIKNLGNLEAITREVIPWGWELTSKGNLMASMLDLTQFRNRALRAINQGDPQMQNLFGNDMAQVEATLKQWMDNHRQDLPGDNKIGSQKRDAINALVGIATNINRNANPFSGKIGGPGSAIKQFRLDRVDTAAGTGRVGFHFDYDKANGNLLPEVATPLPNLSSDIPVQAMSDSVPVRFSNKDFIIRPAGLVSMPGQAFPAYHGTPHKVDRFSTEKIGTGEGAQAYGWGLYFAENEKVAAEYRDALAYKSRRKLYDGGEFNADNPSHVAAFLGEEGVKEFVETGFVDWADTEGISKDQAQKALDWIKSGRQVAKYELTPPSSNLYTVDLDVEPQDLLDWDKPLSEQSEKVQQAVAKARGDIKDWRMAFQDQQSGLWGRTGAASYMDIQLARKVDMAGASKALLAAGIPGIRYLDQGSRLNPKTIEEAQARVRIAKRDAENAPQNAIYQKILKDEEQRLAAIEQEQQKNTYNYVIFDEKLIKITNENGTPVTPQGQAISDAVPDPNAPAQQGYKVPEIYKVIPGPNGKFRVINAEGKKVTDYPTLEKATARATEENNLLAPMSDLKKLFNREDRQAITDAQKRITEVAKNNPEATRLEIQRDETGLPKIDLLEDADGNPILDEKGNQVRGVVFAKKEYELRKAPGLSKDDNVAVKQGVALLLPEAKRVLGIPAIAAGKGWYGRMRDFLQRSFGANIEVFGQLLGATSARTPVDTNFKQALEAVRLVALGKYDDLLQRFDAHVMDIKAKAESGQLKQEWLQKNPNKRESLFVLNDEYRKAINTFKDVPLRDNGAKYNANSQKVLHALYGIWLSQTKGPKTPNFAGNLTGRTLRATIDVWAARNLRRLLYSNKIKKWRILPEQESGVKYTVDKAGNYGGDFEFGQRIYDEVARQLNMNPDDLQAVMWFAEKDVWETNGWTNTVGAEKSSFDKEAGKLNLDRYQIGLTTFTDADSFDPKVQEAERINFRNAVRKVPNLAVARVSESSGLYGGTLEPTFDVEFSVQRDPKIESQNYLDPTIRQALAIADRRGQIDVLTSLVVDADHPNARPMVEVGFKSPAKPAEIDAVVEAFKANGIDGFTIAKNERGDVLGLRSQYVPEISARYDTLDHLDPVKFGQNSDAWMGNAQTALAQIQNIDNVSYRKEGYVSSAIYGKEEYRTVSPVDLRRSSAQAELGRRRSILSPGS